LYNNIWHFGGNGSNPFQIIGAAEDSALSTHFNGETIFINNHNAAPVTFAANIKAFGTNALNLNGPGTTIFSGSNTYTGRTTINSGTLRITGGTSTIGALFLGPAAFELDGNTTSVTLTGSTEMNLGSADTSTFTITAGTFLVQNGGAVAANIGNGGDLTFNQTGGLFHFAPTGTNKLLNIGVAFTGSATLNLSGGTFRTNADVPAYLGGRVTSVMNISGSAMVDIPNLLFNRNLNVPHTATLNLGDGSPGSGTLKANSIVRDSASDHNIGILNFNGGTLQAGAASGNFMSKLTAANIQNGGAVIDTNGFDITIAQPLLNAAGATTSSLTKIGAGALTLSGINQYSGNTVVSAGTLTLGNAADPLNANPANDASTVRIASDATLDLTYTGTDKVAALVIGATPMADGIYGKSGSPSPIIGISQITGDGTLTVGQSGFAAWISGSFANGAIPANRQGPNDDFDNDGISNLIEYAIAAQDPTVPNPNIGTFSSNTLSFAKRADATGITYRIEESTDLGITDDWQEVTGPSYQNLPNVISFTMTPGSPARNFTRLRVTQNS
jgi:autotransporter-associated beta strand protein